jgi:uncharacterized protein YdeI (YjbR/CyaY-like superfamily)
MPEPRFFRSAEAFRRWLESHHGRQDELLVGFYKKDSGCGGITYPEALDEALCFGWIDGVRRRVDDVSYSIRFTPRRKRSIWSRVNLKRVEALEALGKMHAAGLAALARREPERTGVYSFEDRPRELDPAYEAEFKHHPEAWANFQARAPYYRRTAIFWVMSAKKEETRRRRLATLIQDSAKGRLIPPLRALEKRR